MLISDFILIFQTFFILLAAIIAAWYTYETYRIRKETSRQNLLTLKQITLIQNAQEFEKTKNNALFEPIFQWGAVFGKKYHFVNKGAMVSNLKAIPKGDFIMDIKPSNILSNEQEGKVTIRKLPDNYDGQLLFGISYVNQLGEEKQKLFSYRGHGVKEENMSK